MGTSAVTSKTRQIAPADLVARTARSWVRGPGKDPKPLSQPERLSRLNNCIPGENNHSRLMETYLTTIDSLILINMYFSTDVDHLGVMSIRRKLTVITSDVYSHLPMEPLLVAQSVQQGHNLGLDRDIGSSL